MNPSRPAATLAVLVLLISTALPACTARPAPPFDPAPWFASAAAAPTDEPATPIRVGTVSRTEFLIAYYRSAERAEFIQGLIAQRDAARAAGDRRLAADLERQGAASQHQAHQRLAGTASLGPIIDRIRDRLPEVARSANVSMIVEAGSPIPPGAVTVDVTRPVADLFPPAR